MSVIPRGTLYRYRKVDVDVETSESDNLVIQYE